ncbi:hypothetical protein WJX72_002515 [[Myrmecia] bisecta]|uniref:Uncharacterized protein n=1 Tax=[Myrmecia] bisecta TaxID=41462 RepID=A0AAW1P350_9CHLO
MPLQCCSSCPTHQAAACFRPAQIMSDSNMDPSKERSNAQVTAQDQETCIFKWDKPGSWPGGEDLGRTAESLLRHVLALFEGGPGRAQASSRATRWRWMGRRGCGGSSKSRAAWSGKHKPRYWPCWLCCKPVMFVPRMPGDASRSRLSPVSQEDRQGRPPAPRDMATALFSPKVFLDLLPDPLEDLWNRLVSHKVSLVDDQPWMEAEAFRLLEECHCFEEEQNVALDWTSLFACIVCLTRTDEDALRGRLVNHFGFRELRWALHSGFYTYRIKAVRFSRCLACLGAKQGACGSAAKGSKGAPWQCRSRLAIAPGYTLRPAFDLARIMADPTLDPAKERSPEQKVTDPVEQWRLVNDATYKSYVAKMAAMLKKEDSKMLDREVLAGYLPPALVEKGPNSSGGEMTTYLPQLRPADSARVSGVSEYFWPSAEKQAELGQQVFGGRTYQKPDVKASDAAQEKRAKNALELWPWYWHPKMRLKFAVKIMGKTTYERLSGGTASAPARSPPNPRPKRTKTPAKRAPNKRKAPSRSDLAPAGGAVHLVVMVLTFTWMSVSGRCDVL